MQGHGRCLKLFLAFALLLLQYAHGGEMGHSQRDTNVTIRCIERERQALLAFKRGLVDNSRDWKLAVTRCLDLSRNQIEGRIPTSLARIDRLDFLDLSFNNLSGEIPTGTQLQSFDPSVYVGNPQLCGPPLRKMCANQNVQTDLSNQEEDKDELITPGFYISMGLGFAAGFWGVCGSLIFKRSWRYAYFKFLNGLNDWLYVRVALIKRQLKDMLNR